MTNEVQIFKSGLAKANDVYLPQIKQQLADHAIAMNDYQKTCVLNAMTAINEVIVKDGIDYSKLDQSNITKTLLNVAALELNAAATPREVYFITRNQTQGGQKVKVIEMGIEGDGNDAILTRFGRNVKKLHKFWEVRENDDFSYPSFNGLEMTPPKWSPKGRGKVVKVVYPIELTDGTIEYHIAEREDVKRNLLAHMFNNLMWDKSKADKKNKIKEFAETHTLDEILDSEEMQTLGNISPAWKEPQSREAMIIRKMRNNITKKVPKDFSNAYIESAVQQVEDEAAERQYEIKQAEVIEEITTNANSEDFEIEEKPEEREKNKTVEQEEKHEAASITDAADEVLNQSETQKDTDGHEEVDIFEEEDEYPF